jgi:hypothetical protein
MAESRISSSTNAASADKVPDLDDAQLRRLTELVYRLIRDQVVLENERRAAGSHSERR